MTDSAPDLWGDDFVTAGPDSPVALLREQARRLGVRTDGRVRGEVTAYASGDSLVLQLDAVTGFDPFGDGDPGARRHALLTVACTGDPYPVVVQWGGQSEEAGDISGLRIALRRALQSREVRVPVEALLAQLAVAG